MSGGTEDTLVLGAWEIGFVLHKNLFCLTLIPWGQVSQIALFFGGNGRGSRGTPANNTLGQAGPRANRAGGKRGQ